MADKKTESKPDPVAALTRKVAKLQAEVTAMKAQLGAALGVSFDDA